MRFGELSLSRLFGVMGPREEAGDEHDYIPSITTGPRTTVMHRETTHVPSVVALALI